MQRLSKVIAGCGVASRRACEELIQSGRVRVNGKVTVVPQTMVDIEKDKILVDGKKVEPVLEKVVFALHKPVGYICTADPRIKKRAIDLVEADVPRLYTIGRLDRDTSGLILVTNDGVLAHQIMHPSFEVPKEYIAHVDKEISHEHLVALSKGILIDGLLVKPVEVEKVRKGTVKIIVCDGKKHEVRELLGSQGFEVLALKRVRIGGLRMGSLPVGAFRKLNSAEIEAIIRETKRNAS